ncbi:MAG: PEP_CTERM-anchored TLD domain-containing protein [Alphaproteobacteria bacterium]|nr:PEP_CTERM-anchored TLD domain-containing protein [Alphaproteobacteria bacterium]
MGTIMSRKFLWALCAALFIALPAQAASIVGGSSMLGASEAAQLETWLGQGSLTLTNIFTKGVTGTTSTDWHNTVDNQGATFSIMEMVAYDPSQGQNVTQIVGGYNPQSWDASIGNWVITPNDADRTAFIFNLTTGVLHRQCRSTDPVICGYDNDTGPDNWIGQYQTFNRIDFGPTFGNGQDLFVGSTLNFGLSSNYSYGVAGGLPGSGSLNGLDPNPTGYHWVSVGDLETFTVAVSPNDVPAPGALALFGLGLLGLGVMRRRTGNAG